MNEQAIIQWVVLGIVVTMIAFDKVKAWQVKNTKPPNGKKSNPGNYGNRITRLETKMENVEKAIDEIKKKLDKMNSYRK